MKDLVKKQGLSSQIYVESAATSTEELGNPVHPGTKRILQQHGISCAGKTARQMTREDYESFDYIICMDHWNYRNMDLFIHRDTEDKYRLLLSFCGEEREVADPWYTGDFEATWEDVTRGCEALLEWLKKEKRLL
jgi:protein-tyrosine phosphatase